MGTLGEEIEHYQMRMHRHQKVVLVGTSVGVPPSQLSWSTKAVRQLQLTGDRQADCLCLMIIVLHMYMQCDYMARI